MICPSCGKTILDSSKFCPFCGYKTIIPEEVPQPESAPAPEAAPAPEQPQYGQYQQPEQPQYGQYQQPYQPYGQYYTQPEPAPETTKPRSAYQAALLHILLGVFGLGYYYRGMKEKAKTCIILFIVGLATSWIFGIGGIVILVCEILNVIEGIKLFKGDYPTDAYGRTLYQEF